MVQLGLYHQMHQLCLTPTNIYVFLHKSAKQQKLLIRFWDSGTRSNYLQLFASSYSRLAIYTGCIYCWCDWFTCKKLILQYNWVTLADNNIRDVDRRVEWTKSFVGEAVGQQNLEFILQFQKTFLLHISDISKVHKQVSVRIYLQNFDLHHNHQPSFFILVGVARCIWGLLRFLVSFLLSLQPDRFHGCEGLREWR